MLSDPDDESFSEGVDSEQTCDQISCPRKAIEAVTAKLKQRDRPTYTSSKAEGTTAVKSKRFCLHCKRQTTGRYVQVVEFHRLASKSCEARFIVEIRSTCSSWGAHRYRRAS